MRILRKLRILARRGAFNRELEEEMALHHELAEKDLLAQGMTSEAAHHAARRQFGNATRLKEQSHEVAGFGFESVLYDLRFAFRQLGKNPGFTATAVLMLALGMCASVAIFAFVDAALIKPLPYPSPTRLVFATESVAMLPRANLSYFDYLDWKRLNKVFRSLDVWADAGYLLSTPTGAQPAVGMRVSDGFFRTLGVTPLLGRDFYASEDLPHTVILSYAAWQNRFGGRAHIIGQPVTLSGVRYTVIGVLRRDFQFAPRGAAEFWAPLQPSGDCDLRRSCHNLNGIARLKDGVSVQTAQADMTTVAQQLEKQYPQSNRGQGATVISLSEFIVGDIRPILLVLLSGAGLLLLIACINVASLLLVRSEGRKREIAVRGALGASPARLVRQFVTEAIVLVAAGGALGVVAAQGAMHLLSRLVPTDMMAGMPYLQGLGLDLHVAAFAGAVCVLAAALFSIAPITRLRKSDLREGLAEGGWTSAGTVWRRFGSNLVVAELAIAAVLLVSAGLLGKSFYRLLRVDLGFQPDHLATLQVAAPEIRYKKDAVALGRQIVERISRLPGVKSAAITSRLPVTYNGNTTWIRVRGRAYNGEHDEVNERDVSSGFFTTLQAKLLRGRYFTDAEDASKPGVVIINQALARKYFPGEDPLGKVIGDTDLSPKSLAEIIGVVDDIREGALDSDIYPAAYFPFNQSSDPYFYVIARTSQAPQSVLGAMAANIREIGPAFATSDEAAMSDAINQSSTAYLHRSSAWLVGCFATLALLLGVVGLYGVIAYSVGQRTREIGIRMALGAARGAVYQMVLKEAGGLIVMGIGVGLLCAVAAAALMGKLLFGIHSWDPPTLAAVAVILAGPALLASYIPAQRAAAVNPVEALRAE